MLPGLSKSSAPCMHADGLHRARASRHLHDATPFGQLEVPSDLATFIRLLKLSLQRRGITAVATKLHSAAFNEFCTRVSTRALFQNRACPAACPLYRSALSHRATFVAHGILVIGCLEGIAFQAHSSVAGVRACAQAMRTPSGDGLRHGVPLRRCCGQMWLCDSFFA
jgi:hypothetical protein